MENYGYLGLFGVWHFILFWAQASLLSLIIDWRLHQSGWLSLSKIAFRLRTIENRNEFANFSKQSSEIFHRFAVYLITVALGWGMVFGVLWASQTQF